MNPQEHYEAAMAVMASHDRLVREVETRVGRPMSTEQSVESATWVIAHALMGLLAAHTDPEITEVIDETGEQGEQLTIIE